jgi:D-glycero-alpha-D-manno-heptose-7-phosphate kinase
MIITRTPFRISFFGGGTDYPSWYREHGGSVISTSIDKYCYITCRVIPPFFEHKHRIVYSYIENVREIDEIKHPSARAVFKWAKVEEGLEIHHDADLPARSGLGSSSAFTVGLAHAIYGIRGKMVNSEQLAKDAIYIEQELIGESVGSQDQIAVAHGGFNRIDFNSNDTYNISPIVLPKARLDELSEHLMLFFTGFSRIADEVAKSQIANMQNKELELNQMGQMVNEAISILSNKDCDIIDFGLLLHESWQLKRSLSAKITTPAIDAIYQDAINAGAIGGKILGAGGGGFMLLFVQPEKRQKVRDQLNHLIHVPFKFENTGSRVVLYQPNGL